MSKFCPNCGKELPDDSKFCLECGHDFSKNKNNSTTLSGDNDSNIFLNGKIFLILIVIILIIGAVFIFGFNGNNNNDISTNISSGVDLTITEINGYDADYDNKTSYTYYVNALFTKVPDDKEGYLVKTIYYDNNNTEIGNTVESLSNLYLDTKYPVAFGFYTVYKLVNIDNVKVQIIKDGNVLDEFNSKVDQNKIRW